MSNCLTLKLFTGQKIRLNTIERLGKNRVLFFKLLVEFNFLAINRSKIDRLMIESKTLIDTRKEVK